MKKVYVLMLALAVVCCLPVTAQVKFGIKGGLDVTSMSMSSDVLNSENREGFYIGPGEGVIARHGIWCRCFRALRPAFGQD